MEVEM